MAVALYISYWNLRTFQWFITQYEQSDLYEVFYSIEGHWLTLILYLERVFEMFYCWHRIFASRADFHLRWCAMGANGHNSQTIIPRLTGVFQPPIKTNTSQPIICNLYCIVVIKHLWQNLFSYFVLRTLASSLYNDFLLEIIIIVEIKSFIGKISIWRRKKTG